MYKGYGQYCPLALAAELLCQRWTVLVISRLIDGCRTFTEIHRGVPLISPSMLSQRLSELEEAGLLTRRKRRGGRGYTYHPTEAALGLEGIITDVAVWGQQWARDMMPEDLDPGFLAWSMSLRLESAAMPSGRTVLEFDFSGAPKETHRFWLVNRDGNVDMCLKHPGYDTDILIEGDLRTFVECWRGFRNLREEIEARRVKLTGPHDLKRSFPDWLQFSMFASHRRKRAGQERTLCDRSTQAIEM